MCVGKCIKRTVHASPSGLWHLIISPYMSTADSDYALLPSGAKGTEFMACASSELDQYLHIYSKKKKAYNFLSWSITINFEGISSDNVFAGEV